MSSERGTETRGCSVDASAVLTRTLFSSAQTPTRCWRLTAGYGSPEGGIEHREHAVCKISRTVQEERITPGVVVGREKATENADCSLQTFRMYKIAMHRRVCHAQEFEEEPHLESAEGGITVKGQLVLNPTARAKVFAIESHEEYRVYSIDDGIADPARLCEVGAFVTDWVVFISAHSVSLCLHLSHVHTWAFKMGVPYASHACY